ncbi:hypothetical protein [Spelaeicoccus albus]|uniref:Uncharacterized protein n=1 Tax=Spelaeicoccus albus TaxID=1280376 RepID=A0A7Z0IJE9_9MICO|nr:hypothetical protein [Spelaeicoccus albus]NYI69337.1 hypothetical protein [Spelaeicoccus albus]
MTNRQLVARGRVAPVIAIAALLLVLVTFVPAGGTVRPGAPSSEAAGIAAVLQKKRLYVGPGVADALGKKPLDRAADKARGLDYPVYIIAVKDDDADNSVDSTDLLDSIHSALGRKGLYILVPAGGLVNFDVYDVKQFEQIYEQAKNWRAQTPSGTPAATSLNTFLNFLAHPKKAPSDDAGQVVVPPSSIDTDAGIGVGGIIGYGSLALIAVIAAVAALIVRGRRRKYRMPRRILTAVRNSQRSDLRKELSDDTLGISARLQQLHVTSLTANAADRVRHGLDAYDLAGRIVDDDNSGAVDLAGAMVLLRVAERDLFAVDSGGKSAGRGPRAFSSVNPLHGEATTTAKITTSGGATIEVPATKDEAADLKAGRTPAWLNDGDAPYFTRQSVWASTLFGATGADLVDTVTKEIATRGSL